MGNNKAEVPATGALANYPRMAGVSVGVPSVAAPSGVASTHGVAFPAMAVPNPTTPLGAFLTQTPLPAGQLHTLAMNTLREKSRLCPSLSSKVVLQPPSLG